MAAFKELHSFSRKEGTAIHFLWVNFHHVERVRVYWDELGLRTIECEETIAHNISDFGTKDEPEE